MAAAQQATDRITTNEPTESLNILALDDEGKSSKAEDAKEQPLSTKGEGLESSEAQLDATTVVPSRDGSGQPGSVDASGDSGSFYPPNVYAPQAYYIGGYDAHVGEWDEYPPYVNAEGMEVGSPGVYNENQSVVYHPSFGYNPQMPYGPYSPATTPLPSVRGDGQLYPPQQYSFAGPYYQQPVPPGLPYINSPTPLSQAELSSPSAIDQQQGGFLADASNTNAIPFGPRPNYPVPFGSFGRGSLGGNSGNPTYYNARQGYDGFGNGSWSDWSKAPDGHHRSLTGLASPTSSSQPMAALGSFGHSIAPLSPATQQRPLYGIGGTQSSYSRGYPQSRIYQSGSFGRSSPALGAIGRSWIAVEKSRRRGRGGGSLCNCNGTIDALTEQNRGPRMSRSKNPQGDQNSSADTKNGTSESNELYNRLDFNIEYKDAKFFIIKSYSEDNVHKSIKYGVWASTANGNRKLDAAYRESKEKDGHCPVFLLFSVNASAQFCGVAEMMGPVDFEKSVDYWQQDKWSGQFPVKWHIVKDVPNSQFRHIILENNDNKPVTNSRDTQEVKLEQGLEILKIFKNYNSNVSILDDFEFYETRQKAMQERKARQQQAALAEHTKPASSALSGEKQATPQDKNQTAVPFSSDVVKQLPKTFANVLRLGEAKVAGKENPSPEKVRAQVGDEVSATTSSS
ncbi:uncharacterized protein LOC18440791 isoform X2 [Amborella trichopoda]|uniref:uncharacterized protein LOC18440791 isoform X2 n=1 Tax=Amborella trichopoda TaxID=13333 RepID=UPI0005D3AF72|nr:uncharacterized protein LOC18440791 isoform X2 [Amborella trichopoda]|eukprot:XP_011625785.1 uncharacterized protein LOC18440791 isoform X2 [Amborella trichopoda]